MKKISMPYLHINKKFNLVIFILLIIKTVIFIIDNSKTLQFSPIDILNTHYVNPISYKVTLVLFLYFISINLEYFYDEKVVIRSNNRFEWFKDIVKSNYILSFIYASSIFLISISLFYIINFEMIGIEVFISIIINSFLNMISFCIFSIIYSVIRMYLNKPIHAFIIEILLYLTINEIIFNILIYDFLGEVFFVDSINLFDIKKFIISIIILKTISLIGHYISENKSFIKGNVNYE